MLYLTITNYELNLILQLLFLTLEIVKTVYCYQLSWKLNILKIIDSIISFYCNDLDSLSPKHKFTFRIPGILKRYVLAPADKAANNVIV